METATLVRRLLPREQMDHVDPVATVLDVVDGFCGRAGPAAARPERQRHRADLPERLGAARPAGRLPAAAVPADRRYQHGHVSAPLDADRWTWNVSDRVETGVARCGRCRYYSATIIQMSGFYDTSMAIWLSALIASINFVCTFIGLHLVERVGRRSLTLISLAGTLSTYTS